MFSSSYLFYRPVSMFKLLLPIVILGCTALGASQERTPRHRPILRIVGGYPTTMEDHPYLVSIQFDGKQTCGGSMISPTWIVSAAHCFAPLVLSHGLEGLYSVRAGSSKSNSGGEVIPAKRILIHEDYNVHSKMDSDIALVELASPVTIPSAHAIKPSTEYPATGSNATVSGWGRVCNDGVALYDLQTIHIPVVDLAVCRMQYEKREFFVTDNMFCAGNLGLGDQDICEGDSGGPLIVNGLLTGVVSFGGRCAQPSLASVFTVVPYFTSWIEDNTGIEI